MCLPAEGLDLVRYKDMRQHLYFWHATESQEVLARLRLDREQIAHLPHFLSSHIREYARHREMMKKHLEATASATSIDLYAGERAPEHEFNYQQHGKKLLKKKDYEEEKETRTQKANVSSKTSAVKRSRKDDDDDFDVEAAERAQRSQKKDVSQKKLMAGQRD